jgi:hypothetical protein
MKNLNSIFTIFTFVFVTILSSEAQTKVYVPDTAFRSYLNQEYPATMDASGDSLIVTEAGTITGVFNCENRNIADLTGIEYFTKINELNCSNNKLIVLPDISAIKDLGPLRCNGNLLTVLPDLSANTKLTVVNCYHNLITVLPDLSANKDLVLLICPDNRLSVLPDLSANTKLTILNCGKNQLTILPDLSSNTVLTELSCNDNQLTVLPDLSANTALTVIRCFSNQIASLPDLSACTALTELSCFRNLLTSLPDLSANTLLEDLLCNYNKFDFSDARELRLADLLPALDSFSYMPTRPFGVTDSIYAHPGDNIVLHIASQDSALNYQWFLNEEIVEGAMDTNLIINGIDETKLGYYTCKSYGTALLRPPMVHGDSASEFVSAPFIVYSDDTETKPGTDINNGMRIYPNPTHGLLYIQSQQFTDFELYNTMGIRVAQSSDCTVDFTKFTEGTYLIKLNGQGSFCFQKVIYIKD